MKILLVDDEIPIRSYLKTVIDWEGQGFELVEAENGAAAIEILKAGDIRLMLLDITMPVMSGLEVLEWLNRNAVNCVVSLLTNHDEFTFAQKAIRLGCFDYVLKSDITGESILALLEKMRQELSEESRQESRLAALETAARRKARSELQDSINYWLCSPDVPDKSVVDLFRAQLGFHDTKSRYALLDIAISDYSSVVHRYTGSDIVQFAQVFDGVLNELLESHLFFYTKPREGIFLVFLRFSRQESVQAILNRTQTLTVQIDSSFRNLLGIHSSIVYCLPFSFIHESKERYRRVEKLRPLAFFLPGKEIYCLEDYNQDAEACHAFLAEFETLFFHKLSTRNILEIEMSFDETIKRILDQRFCIDPDDFTRSCERCVSRFFSEQTGDKQPFRSSAPYQDCADLKKALLDALRPRCLSNEDQDKNLLIKKALLLIQQHYSEDIGLEWLATRLWVNPSYLSRIFSQEVGQPFTTYLSNYRIDQAKRLILSTNLKLYEVAEQTGFSSSIVFSSNFKKLTGKTPSDFRNSAL